MKLFSSTPKENPKITVNGIEAIFDQKQNWWEFTYRDQEFIVFESHIYMPSPEQLDGILSDVAALKPEMIERLTKGWKEWGDIKMNDGESYSINLDAFGAEGSFDVSWSGGSYWGDMGIEFTVKNQKIINETWGD